MPLQLEALLPSKIDKEICLPHPRFRTGIIKDIMIGKHLKTALNYTPIIVSCEGLMARVCPIALGRIV